MEERKQKISEGHNCDTELFGRLEVLKRNAQYAKQWAPHAKVLHEKMKAKRAAAKVLEQKSAES